MIELSDNKDLIGPWVFNQVNKAWAPEGREALGLVRGEEVLAGVVFEDCTLKSVVAHLAIRHKNVPFRKLIYGTFYYAFIDLGVDKVLGFVNSANKAALKTDLRLGFRPEAIVEGVFPNGDLVIMVMNRSDCRWIAPEHRIAA